MSKLTRFGVRIFGALRMDRHVSAAVPSTITHIYSVREFSSLKASVPVLGVPNFVAQILKEIDLNKLRFYQQR